MALIDELRQDPRLADASDDELLGLLAQHPQYQNLSDNALRYAAFGALETAPKSKGEPGFTAGVSAGIDQLQAMGGGLMMAAGDKMGEESLYETGKGIYDRNMAQAAENDLGYGFTDLFTDPDTSALQWAKYTAGNLLPMVATSLAGGGVGGVGARMLAGATAKQAATRGGQALGAYAASTGMEAGAIMGETENADVAIAHGSIAGALDALPIMRALRKVGGQELADKAANDIAGSALEELRRTAGQSMKGAAARGGATQLVMEASTEGLQGLISQHANYWVENNGDSLLQNLGEVDYKAMIDEAAAGGLMGGAMGAPAGVVERSRAGSEVSRQDAQTQRKEQAINEARQQTAEAGGDALDQVNAAQQAEQMADGVTRQEQAADAPRRQAEIGNRIQIAMTQADEMAGLARGSNEGQTRLRNMQGVLNRAEAAFEKGNLEQAERLMNRAEQIGSSLNTNLQRQGSRERPYEGQVVEPERFGGYLGQDSAARLGAPDPSTINMGGPTADTTQYDPQARNVRRDERMAAQLQSEDRLRAQAASQQPQLPNQGIVYGDGPTAGNANTGLDQPFSDPRFSDTGAGQGREASQAEMDRQAQQVAELARTRGPAETAYLPDNTPVQTRYRVVDLSELTPSNLSDGRVNRRYPQELQPRDRTNANSQVQVRNIAANLNPERLGRSTDAATGAPIIGPDGVVESGNGRTMAIEQAYRQNGNQARNYRQYIARQAEAMGMDPTAIEGMEQPVLVRERLTSIDRGDFARRANESTVAGMTSYEQAQADADSLSADDIQAWAPDQGGDPLAASNRDFQLAFVARLGNNEASRYTNRDGQASPELGQRMQRAVFAKAYADSDMVEMATEQGEAMRNLTAALQGAAADLAAARETGSAEALTAIGTINNAVRLVRRSRQDGTPVRELVSQQDVFNDSVPPLTAELALALNTNMRSRRALSEALRYIGQAVRRRAENEVNGALFEDTTNNQDVFNEGFRQTDTEQRAATGNVSGRPEPSQPESTQGREAGPTEGAQEAQAVDAPRQKLKWNRRAKNSRVWNGSNGAVIADHGFSVGGKRNPMFMVFANAKAYDQGNNLATFGTLNEAKQFAETADIPATSDEPLLQSYTEQELVERDQANQKAQQDEAAQRREQVQRAQADAEVGDFNLTGSDKPADEAIARGQSELLEEQRYSLQNEMERAAAAMRRVIDTQEDVRNAVTREDLGAIDFIWGSEGGPATPTGKRKGAQGIAHILEARQRKDGLSEQEAREVAEKIALVVATGKRLGTTKVGETTNTKVTDGNHTAILVKRADDSAWLLSGWENQEKSKASGGLSEIYDSAKPTHSGPTRARPEVGAEATQGSIASDEGIKQEMPPTAESVRKALAGMEDQLGNFSVIDSALELPQQAIFGMALRGVSPRDVKGMYQGDTLYIVAGNNDSLDMAVRTAVHEAVGHKGIRGVLGDELTPVMRQLYRTLPNSREGRAALKEVLETYTFLDRNNAEDQVTIAEEMVAHLLEKGHRAKAWQRAVSKIRELLRKLIPSINWTYTDVLALGEQSRAYLAKQADARSAQNSDGLYSLTGKKKTTLSEQFADMDPAMAAAFDKIGPKTPTRRAVDWFREHADRAGTKIRQGIVDRHAALLEIDQAAANDKDVVQNSTASSSWVLARMANAANGALHAMLHNGRVYLDPKEKVIDLKDDDSKGLGSVLGRLGSAAEIERFMGWIAGNRSAKLAGEGRENLFSAAEIDALQRANQGTTESGQSRAELYNEVFAEFQTYRDDVLAIAEQSGIISAEQRGMWRDEFYVPFYRISEQDRTNQGPIATSGLSRQQAYKKLKGGTDNLNDLLQNTMMNFHHLMEASLKNQAAMQAVDNAEAVGIASKVPESGRDTTNSTFVMRDGQKVFYQIDDPLVFKAITSLAHPGMNSSAMKVMRWFKRIFTNMTTTTPQFMIANLIRDSLQASATSDVSKNALGNMLTGGRALKDARTHARMMASGASFNFGHLYGENPDELRAQLTRNMRDAKIVSGPKGVPDAVRGLWSGWNDLNNFTENMNRAAIFQQTQDSGKGKLYAAFESRDLIDFSAHGAWPAVRILIDIVPFLNARIQGLDKIYRSGVKPGANVMLEAFGKGKAGVSDKQAAARFWQVTGAVAMATMALYAHNYDDEEYQKLEDWQKDTYWFFRAGDQAFFIPKPFEVGAIATLTERMLEQAMDDKATGKLFAQRLGHMVTDTFSFSPVPQAFQPALNIYANRDDFTGRPIEGMGMDRLSPELRRRSSTTAVAQGISNALNSTVGAIGNPEDNPLALSPLQVDHLIQGYFGQIGAWTAGMADTGWRTLNGEEKPARHWYEYQPVRRFYKNLGDEDRYTKYGTVFYDGLREAQRAYSDVKELREMGELEKAREAANSKQDLLRLRKPLNRAQTRLRKVNQRMDVVRRSSLSADEKRQRMDRLRAVKNQIQRALGEHVQEAKAG